MLFLPIFFLFLLNETKVVIGYSFTRTPGQVDRVMKQSYSSLKHLQMTSTSEYTTKDMIDLLALPAVSELLRLQQDNAERLIYEKSEEIEGKLTYYVDNALNGSSARSTARELADVKKDLSALSLGLANTALTAKSGADAIQSLLDDLTRQLAVGKGGGSLGNSTLLGGLIAEQTKSIVARQLDEVRAATERLNQALRQELLDATTALTTREVGSLRAESAVRWGEANKKEEAVRKRLSDQEAALRGVSGAVAGTQAGLDRAIKTQSDLAASLEALTVEVDALDALRGSIAELSDTFDSKVSRVQSDVRELRGDLSQQLRESVAALQAQVSAAQAVQEEAAAVLRLATEEGLAAAQRGICGLDGDLQVLTASLSGNVSQVAGALADLGRDISGQESALRDTAAALRRAERRIESVSVDGQALVADMAARLALLSEQYKGESSDLRQAVQLLTMDLDEGMEALGERQALALRVAEAEVGSLRAQLATQSRAAEEGIGRLDASLVDVQAALDKLAGTVDAQIRSLGFDVNWQVAALRKTVADDLARQSQELVESAVSVRADVHRVKVELSAALGRLETRLDTLDDSVEGRVEAVLQYRSLPARLSRFTQKISRRTVSAAAKLFTTRSLIKNTSAKTRSAKQQRRELPQVRDIAEYFERYGI